MKQAREKNSEICIRITEIFRCNDKTKEIDEKVDTYNKQLRPKYIKFMN